MSQGFLVLPSQVMCNKIIKNVGANSDPDDDNLKKQFVKNWKKAECSVGRGKVQQGRRRKKAVNSDSERDSGRRREKLVGRNKSWRFPDSEYLT